ncbi:MAG: hypothetical protein ACLGSD_06500 [Acidobacteriota bacterium]
MNGRGSFGHARSLATKTLLALCGLSMFSPAPLHGFGNTPASLGRESPLLARFCLRGSRTANFVGRSAASQQGSRLLQQCYFSIDLGKDFRYSHTSSCISMKPLPVVCSPVEYLAHGFIHNDTHICRELTNKMGHKVTIDAFPVTWCPIRDRGVRAQLKLRW